MPLYLEVRNGARALELAPSVRVRATSPRGESFVTNWDQSLTFGELELGVTDEEDKRFILPAHATVELEVPAVAHTAQSWASDGRLVALPGEWTLQVLLYEIDDEASAVPEPAAVSNAVMLTIERPTGRDFPVWQAILTGGVYSIAEEVLAEYPDSPYFPYMSTLVSRYDVMDKVAIISRAIEMHPTSPVVPYLRYARALYYGMEARNVFNREGDLEKAVALSDKGRAELTRLKNGKSPWPRLKGNKQLGQFPNREYFSDLQRLRQKRVPH